MIPTIDVSQNVQDSMAYLQTLKFALHYLSLLLLLSMISKVYCKILVLLKMVQNLENSDIAMAKIEKINIAVTYSKVPLRLG